MALRRNLSRDKKNGLVESSVKNRLGLTLTPYEKPALQILDFKGKKAASLDIANLHDSLQASDKSSIANSKFNPEKSNDRFYLRYENPALAGKGFIVANIESSNPTNPDSSYQDSTLVYLYEDPQQPGTFYSKPIVLVSNRSFDNYPLNGHKDNDPKDQTVLAELGSQITVTYQDDVVGKQETASVSVPIKKVMEVQPFLVRDKKGRLLSTEKDAEKKTALMQESLAPAGIKVEVLPAKIIDLPRGIKLEDGLSARELRRLARYTAKFYPPEKGLRFVMTGDTPLLEGKVHGISYTKEFRRISLKTENAVFASDRSAARTPGHESVHCLIDSVLVEDEKAFRSIGHYRSTGRNSVGFHHNSDFNLMSRMASTRVRELWGSEHLTDAQIEIILQSSILKDPSLQPKSFQRNQSTRQILDPNDNRLVLSPLNII
ncbi:MAG: hypothetical protein K1X66_00080 [Verrucomicrobiae bacterium]|nr:hypothetical protein [Verrucomicrobiae bacterium]